MLLCHYDIPHKTVWLLFGSFLHAHLQSSFIKKSIQPILTCGFYPSTMCIQIYSLVSLSFYSLFPLSICFFTLFSKHFIFLHISFKLFQVLPLYLFIGPTCLTFIRISFSFLHFKIIQRDNRNGGAGGILDFKILVSERGFDYKFSWKTFINAQVAQSKYTRRFRNILSESCKNGIQ